MSNPPASRYVGALLRVTLGQEADLGSFGEKEWGTLLRIAARNGVLIRAADRLGAEDVKLPDHAAQVVARERLRVRTMLEVIHRVSAVCRTHGIPFLFPKAFQHLPDMGRDLDLLVVTSSTDVDAHLRRELSAVPLAKDFHARIVGSASYRLPDCTAPLDIQHGRLGVVGEYVEFASTLLKRSRPAPVPGGYCDIPSPEDQLVLQGMQRVYGRVDIRVADIGYTIAALSDSSLDWDYVIGTARELGILPGLSCYLSYVDQIHVELFGVALSCPLAARRLVQGTWGRLRFRGDTFRFPMVTVYGRLYLERVGTALVSGKWARLPRLCLVPPLGAVALFGRASRRLRT